MWIQYCKHRPFSQNSRNANYLYYSIIEVMSLCVPLMVDKSLFLNFHIFHINLKYLSYCLYERYESREKTLINH